MEKNQTFSAHHAHKVTRDHAFRSVFFGYLLALVLSLVPGAFREVLILGAWMLLFRALLGAPQFSFLLWGGEILALGTAAALLAREGGTLFSTFTPFYWGLYLFLSLSLVFFSRRFLVAEFLLTLSLAVALSGAAPWIIFSLFGGAAGGIYPFLRKEGKYITFM